MSMADIIDVEKGAASGKGDVIETSSVSSPISDHAQGNLTVPPKSLTHTQLLVSIVNADEVGVGRGKESQKDHAQGNLTVPPISLTHAQLLVSIVNADEVGVGQGKQSQKDHAQGNLTVPPAVSLTREQLLVSIANADEVGVGRAKEPQKNSQKPRIQKVPYSVRNNGKYLHPQEVSLGPYHHGKSQQLLQMEERKIKAARQFVNSGSKKDVQRFYDAVDEVRTKARESYSEETTAALSDEEFTGMMFLDGCFILHFILATNKGEITTSLVVSKRLISQIVQDMFMLENQVPFIVLHALMKMKLKEADLIEEICKFIDKQMFLSYPRHSYPGHSLFNEITEQFACARFLRICGHSKLFGNGEDAPLHLLDMLRTILLANRSSERIPTTNHALDHFGSVIELKKEGIRFGKSHSSKLITGVKFNERCCCLPQLLLPPMVINDTSISQMLNLIAFEMCPDNHSDRGVTAYISFLDSLINHADDVKELRSKGILFHQLGSDEEVAKRFNEWPIEGLSDNLEAYEKVKQGIVNYRRNSARIRIGEWLYTYFRRPWTAISLVAAILLLFLTGVQTYLAAFPKHVRGST